MPLVFYPIISYRKYSISAVLLYWQWFCRWGHAKSDVFNNTYNSRYYEYGSLLWFTGFSKYPYTIAHTAIVDYHVEFN